MHISATSDINHVDAASTPTDLLSTLVYRSRAVRPLSGADLYQLARAAQARNRTESITGLMLHDATHFFQYLEGPPDALARVMHSIRHDPRHTQLEVLDDQPIVARRFGDWAMKLATSGRRAAVWKQEVIKPPRAIIEGLRRDPGAAPKLLAKLAPAPSSVNPDDATLSRPLDIGRMASVLKTLILTTVVPELAARRGLNLRLPESQQFPVDDRARALAHLLITSDHIAALDLINNVARGGHPLRLYGRLFEPAARHLGDLFREDSCSEFDVTLGLSRLQTAIRIQSAGQPPFSREAVPAPTVLVASEPGEPHALSAVLGCEVLWHAGWAPRCEYPARDEALQDLLAASWFDALDLSLSAAFRREHWLPRMTDTITRARRASRNPMLAIVVSGRIFGEQKDAGNRVGADQAVANALDTDQAILHALANLPTLSRSRAA